MRRFGLVGAVLALLVFLALVALPAGSALAATTTIGKTGSNTGAECAGFSVWADTNYVVPPGGGAITSFSFQSDDSNQGEQLAFLVLRRAGGVGGTVYTVVGKTDLVTLKGFGRGIETFSPKQPISVQAGDILGFWLSDILRNCGSDVTAPSGGVVTNPHLPNPNPGENITLLDADNTFDLNEAATLVTLPSGMPPPTSKSQCRHGGWKSFGTAFKNQGDCVSFVATRGKNLPGGKLGQFAGQAACVQIGGRFALAPPEVHNGLWECVNYPVPPNPARPVVLVNACDLDAGLDAFLLAQQLPGGAYTAVCFTE